MPADVRTRTRLQVRVADPRVRFLMVGAANTAWAYVLFAALQLTVGQVAHYLVVLLLSHVLSVLTAFAMYRRFVFHVRGGILRDLARFWSLNLGLLALNAALLPPLVDLVGLPVLLAQASLVVVTAATSYWGHRSFSFARPKAAP